MKKHILLLFLFGSFIGLSQEKEIITLYDAKGNETKDPLKTRIIQKVSKENDSLWLFRRFRRNNQLAVFWSAKHKDGKVKVGKMLTFHTNDSIASSLSYNNQGQKHGKFTFWFDNRNKNFEGRYTNGKRVGLWRRYYYSGELSSKAFFKNDSLLSEKFYTKEGNEKEKSEDCCKRNASFKGGQSKYAKLIKKFIKKLNYKIKGKIIVDYTIGVDGGLTNIRIYDDIPKDLETKIIHFFSTIKGWNPSIQAGREVPQNHSISLNFE